MHSVLISCFMLFDVTRSFSSVSFLLVRRTVGDDFNTRYLKKVDVLTSADGSLLFTRCVSVVELEKMVREVDLYDPGCCARAREWDAMTLEDAKRNILWTSGMSGRTGPVIVPAFPIVPSRTRMEMTFVHLILILPQ